MLRRTRLSLVASLFLALLGGAGVAAAGEPTPAPVTAVSTVSSVTAVSSVVAAPAVAPAAEVLAAGPGSPSYSLAPLTAGPAVSVPPAAVPPAVGAPARNTRLNSQFSGAAAGPRAPPASA
ncbi:hypothetical protein CLV70_11728 [Pseudosporangium ferrugineum]|uniref:Uncharacterized protein n=1 Tax=Pseudosporangium ferrugineum TaxID=439699 RepID=A0A2T0RMA8_9ACTN|nr:hypothetical protein CLV70_11728 [Pseudosporangium ferrugineum]